MVNPARAGMIPISLTEDYGVASKPRASGDDPRVGAAQGHFVL